MAGKSGGSWKVAYADFVTAMMAFFMVMWISSQDQKVKQAVARYFNNPMNLDSLGMSTKPDRMGSVFDSPSSGSVPQAESAALGQGRHSHSPTLETSPATKRVGDWINQDDSASKHWREQARRVRDVASRRWDVQSRQVSADDVAKQLLAKQMQEELTGSVPHQLHGVHQDLLYGALSEVNWKELAEDLLTN